MIKKLFLGLFVFVGFISFVSAESLTASVGIDSYNSPVNSSYTFTPLKGGAFLSSYLGVSKSVLALNTSRLFWWTENGYPYFYLKSSNSYIPTVEGQPDRYYSCDLFTGAVEPQNCTESIIDYSGSTTSFDKQVFKSFFNTVVKDGLFYVENGDYRYVGATWNYYYNALKVCWNSEEIGKSFCFKAGQCNDDPPSYCNTFGGLVNSQNLNGQFEGGLTYGLLANSWLGYAPGQAGYDGGFIYNDGGSSSSVSNSVITGNVMYEQCTIGKVVNYYNNLGYSKNLCYAGIPLNTSGLVVPIAGTGVDYLDLYISMTSGDSSDMSMMEWFTYWRNTFTQWNNGSSPSVNNPFIGYDPALYSYFGFVEKYGVAFSNDKIIDYCFMLDEDLNSPYVGSDFALVCSQSSDSAYYIGSGGSIQGSVVGSDWSAVFSGENKDYSFVGALNEFFNKLTTSISQLNTSDLGLGILPTYIITVLLGLILFRFLSH